MFLFILFTILCILITYIPYKIFDALYYFYKTDENDKEHLYVNIYDLSTFIKVFLTHNTFFKAETINVFISLAAMFSNIKTLWNSISAIFIREDKNKEALKVTANIFLKILSVVWVILRAILIVTIIFSVFFLLAYFLVNNSGIIEYINKFARNLSHIRINIGI